MFEEEILVGETERRIRLQTHKGSDIANVIEPEPGERERRVYALIRAKHPDWRQRKPACGVYNCFGMVFASRRTSILEPDQIIKILTDDGYGEIDKDHAGIGDLALYWDRQRGECVHAAVILRRKSIGTTPVLFALSKWNSACGEDVHRDNDHCYRNVGDIVLRYFTDRPTT